MSIQWTLAGRIGGGEEPLTVEEIRPIPATELLRLDEAQRVLASLTSASPYKAVVDAYNAAVEAFQGLRTETTESKTARQERARHALQLVIDTISAAPDELSRLASKIIGKDAEVPSVMSAAQQLQAEPAWGALLDADTSGAAQLAWIDTPSEPEVCLLANDGSRTRIQHLLNTAMAGLAVVTARVFVAAADQITAASRIVRGLEAEVLFGRPTLAGFPAEDVGDQNGKLQFRELPTDVMAAAQGTLRRSRDLLAAADGTSRSEAKHHVAEDSEEHAQEPEAETTANPSQEQPSSDTAAASDGGERAATAVRPPVDLYRVAQHLAETLTAVEKAYGEAPSIEAIFEAVEQDKGAYGSLLRQIGVALNQTDKALRTAGFQPVRVNVPPTSNDITALTLDDPSPRVRLRQQFTAELLVVEGAAEQLQSLQIPSDLHVGLGGVVVSARFDPAAPGRVRGWMLQAARMAELSRQVAATVIGEDACPDTAAEEDWLARAATICFDNGLHEAALLYLVALAASSSTGGSAGAEWVTLPQELAVETLRRFAVGETREASAVAISLIRFMWPALTARLQAAGGSHSPQPGDPPSNLGDADSSVREQ